jgi:nucleoside-diphosphate-sugar epimerase
VVKVLKNVKAQVIFNLAAIANVQQSWLEPGAILANNIQITANLLEAARMSWPQSTIVHCSTSEVYGNSLDDMTDENAASKPLNPYAISKLSQEQLALLYHRAYGLPIIVTRAFGYINPRREDLVASAFAKQIAEIEHGKRDELVHGNLDSVRTFLDVRDVVEAYWLAAQEGEPGEVYNIGSDRTVTIGEVLDILKKMARKPIPSRLDQTLLRPQDISRQVGNSSKFKAATGWGPKIPLEFSLAWVLDYWREKVQG